MSQEKHQRGLFHHHKDEDKPSDYPQSGYSDEGRPGGIGGGYCDTNEYSGEGRTGGPDGGDGDINAYSGEGRPGGGRYSETTAAYGGTTTHESEIDYKKEDKHHKHLEHLGEAGVDAAGAFALHEKHKKKKTPTKIPTASAGERHCDFSLERETKNDAVKMFRNQYDTDMTTWSPAGRLFQVEYAMEAVKQGSAAIGLRSKTHVVLACVNKANSELSSHQKKIFKVDDHIGVAIAGLTADGRVLSRYMRSKAMAPDKLAELWTVDPK